MVIVAWGDKHGDMCELHCWDVLVVDWSTCGFVLPELRCRHVQLGGWLNCQSDLLNVCSRQVVRCWRFGLHNMRCRDVLCGIRRHQHSCMLRLHAWDVLVISRGDRRRCMFELRGGHIKRGCGCIDKLVMCQLQCRHVVWCWRGFVYWLLCWHMVICAWGHCRWHVRCLWCWDVLVHHCCAGCELLPELCWWNVFSRDWRKQQCCLYELRVWHMVTVGCFCVHKLHCWDVVVCCWRCIKQCVHWVCGWQLFHCCRSHIGAVVSELCCWDIIFNGWGIKQRDVHVMRGWQLGCITCSIVQDVCCRNVVVCGRSIVKRGVQGLQLWHILNVGWGNVIADLRELCGWAGIGESRSLEQQHVHKLCCRQVVQHRVVGLHRLRCRHMVERCWSLVVCAVCGMYCWDMVDGHCAQLAERLCQLCGGHLVKQHRRLGKRHVCQLHCRVVVGR